MLVDKRALAFTTSTIVKPSSNSKQRSVSAHPPLPLSAQLEPTRQCFQPIQSLSTQHANQYLAQHERKNDDKTGFAANFKKAHTDQPTDRDPTAVSVLLGELLKLTGQPPHWQSIVATRVFAVAICTGAHTTRHCDNCIGKHLNIYTHLHILFICSIFLVNTLLIPSWSSSSACCSLFLPFTGPSALAHGAFLHWLPL